MSKKENKEGKTFELTIQRLIPMTAVYYAEGPSEEVVLSELNEFFEEVGEDGATVLDIKEIEELPSTVQETAEPLEGDDNVVHFPTNTTKH